MKFFWLGLRDEWREICRSLDDDTFKDWLILVIYGIAAVAWGNVILSILKIVE